MNLHKRFSFPLLLITTLYVVGIRGNSNDYTSLLHEDGNILEIERRAQKIRTQFKNKEATSTDIYKLHKEFEKALATVNLTLNDNSRHSENKENLLQYLNDSTKWYELLIKLYDRLASVDVQETRESYENQTLVLKCRDGIELGGKISTIGLDLLYPDISHDVNYEALKERVVNKFNVNALCEILNVTLGQPSYTLTSTGKDTLVVTGDFIRLRDIVGKHVTQERRDECNDSDCPRVLKIFALNTIFIDTSLQMPLSDSLIVLMSPKWVILTKEDLARYGLGQTQLSTWKPTITLTHPDRAGDFFGIGMNFLKLTDLHVFTVDRLTGNVNDDAIVYQLRPKQEYFYSHPIGSISPFPKSRIKYDQHNLFNEYRLYLLKHLKDDIRLKGLTDFLFQWYTYRSFRRGTFNIYGFFRELEQLDEYFETFSQEMNVLAAYESLRDRFDAYREQNNWEIPLENSKMHRTLVDTLITTIAGLLYPNDVNANLTSLINECIYNLENIYILEDSARQRKISLVENTLSDRLQEVRSSIMNNSVPELDSINTDLANELWTWVYEIDAPNKAVANTTSSQRITILKHTLHTKTIFANLLVFARALSQGFSMYAEEFKQIDSPLTLGYLRNTDYVRDRTYILNHLSRKLNRDRPQLVRLKSVISETQEELGYLVRDNGLEIVDQYFMKMEKNLTGTHDLNECDSNTDTLCVVHNLHKELKVARMSPDTYLKYKDNPSVLSTLEKVAKQTDEDEIRKLDQYEYYMQIVGCPALERLLTYLMTEKDVDKMTNTEFIAATDTIKWRVLTMLEDTKTSLRDLIKEHSKRQKMFSALDELISIVKNIFNIYYEKAIYLKFKHVNNLMDWRNTGEDNLTKILARLKSNSFVMRNYKILYNTFKMYIFPIIEPAEGLGNADPMLKKHAHKTISEIAVEAMWEIIAMKIKLPTYSTTLVNKYDGVRLQANFTSASEHGPFYTWKYNSRDKLAWRLLSGETVKMNASITNGVNDNCVKFRKFKFLFKAADQQVQQRLDEQLKEFIFNVTHSGKSYYRCGNRLFKITTLSTRMLYSVYTGQDGEPTVRNARYRMWMNGDFLLSPYTEWSLSLEPGRGNSNAFAKLAEFRDLEIDVVLEGVGQYIRGKNICNKNLKDYYELVN